MPKVQIVFPKSSTSLFGWTVGAVLICTPRFEGIRWGEPVDGDADLVIFIADPHQGASLNLDPIRTAVRAGLMTFVVTGGEGTVSPADLDEIPAEGQVYFFHAKKPVGFEGFLPFSRLSVAIQRRLLGLSLED